MPEGSQQPGTTTPDPNSVLVRLSRLPGAQAGIRAVVSHLEGLGHKIENERDLVRAMTIAQGAMTPFDWDRSREGIDRLAQGREIFTTFFNDFLNDNRHLQGLTRKPDGEPATMGRDGRVGAAPSSGPSLG
jgi:hypothetical protein